MIRMPVKTKENQGIPEEWVHVDTLKPWDDNPRKNSEAVSEVAKSLISFGWGSPILARSEDRLIVAGHTRRLAAKKLPSIWRGSRRRDRDAWHADAIRTMNTGEVAVRFKSGLSDAEAKALSIADNKKGEIATWDDDKLAAQLRELADEGIAVDTGFSEDELAKLLEDFDSETPGDDGPQLSNGLNYQVIVQCDNERHQADVLSKLEADGLKCKPLVT